MGENIKLIFLYSFLKYICPPLPPTQVFSEEPLSQRMRMKERLNFSFKYISRFCSNLMTQDLALYLNLLLQDFILILNKCSHMGTENKTGKCCLSFPLHCYYVSFKCTDCSVLPMWVIVLTVALFFLFWTFSNSCPH